MRIPLRTSQSTKRLLVAIPVTVNTNQYAFIAGQNRQRGTHRRLIVIIEAIHQLQFVFALTALLPYPRPSSPYGNQHTTAAYLHLYPRRHSPAR